MKQELTISEAAFAAEHHEIIYRYLNDRGLSEDGYYDIVVFAFLSTVRRGITPDFEQKAFAAMDKAVCEAQTECPFSLISLDGDELLSSQLEKEIADVRSETDEAIENMHIAELLHSFNQQERLVAELLIAGYPMEEVRAMLTISMSDFRKTVDTMKKRLSAEMPAAA